MTTEIKTGTDVIRAALYARNARLNLGPLAREIGVSADLLEQFLAGRVTLLPTVLNDLARELFSGHAVYDET